MQSISKRPSAQPRPMSSSASSHLPLFADLGQFGEQRYSARQIKAMIDKGSKGENLLATCLAGRDASCGAALNL